MAAGVSLGEVSELSPGVKPRAPSTTITMERRYGLVDHHPFQLVFGRTLSFERGSSAPGDTGHQIGHREGLDKRTCVL